jgi:SpoIID/LytB domain protein
LTVGAAPAELLLDTVYSASCGGHTEDNDRAWGTRPDPVLRGRLDLPEADRRRFPRFSGPIGEVDVAAFLAHGAELQPLCSRPRGAQSSYRWTAQVKAEAILKYAGAELGPLREVTVLARGASGRVVALRLAGAGGTREIHGELEVRRALGGLKSALFTLAPVRQGGVITSLEVRGGGYGHGVGMCQQGAIGLGEAGQSYRQILEHYYPGAALRRLY